MELSNWDNMFIKTQKKLYNFYLKCSYVKIQTNYEKKLKEKKYFF